MRTRKFLVLAALVLAGLSLRAEDAPALPSREARVAIANALKWQTGTITLQDGLAKINLTGDFRYLNSADARKVLHDLWRNPDDPNVLGMIFPADKGPLDRDNWAVMVSYEKNGYVKDDDADKIDYNDLLKKMQAGTRDENEERKKDGSPTLELVGWATPPRYDKTNHKLYWAKELKVEAEEGHQLNYDIRILGRRGVLVLTALAGMDQLSEVEQKTPEILSMVDFQPGNTYAEFDPKVDKVAEYGLAGLIAGGVLAGAAKLGLLKGLWVGILALKKFILIGFVALVAGFKKMMARFSGKSQTPDHLLPPRPPGSS